MTYRLLGTTDERDTCDCCGRTRLKSTVALEPTEGGDVVYFGVTCAARALRWGIKETRTAVRAADDARAAEVDAARRIDADAHLAAWDTFLMERAPDALVGGTWDRFQAIQALGGYAVARAAFQLL